MAQRADPAGGYSLKINENYLRTASARHLPTEVSLIFMRLCMTKKCWYCSLCFAGAAGYLPWKDDAAELWLWALFDVGRPQVLATPFANPSARQFTLPVAPQPRAAG